MALAVRLIVSASLLGLVIWQVDWRETRSGLATADLAWLAAAFMAFNGAMVFAGLRWGIIVRAGARQRIRLPWTVSVRATYVSLWLSNFLPTAFGGDVARVFTAQRAGASLSISVSATMFDRYCGLTMLALLFLISEAGSAMTGQTRPFLPSAAILTAALGIPLLLVWHGSALSLRRSWLRSRVVRFVARSTGILRKLRSEKRASAAVVATSIVATVLGVAAYWCAIRSQGAGPSFATALAVAALGTLASTLPVSVSGWGVREGAVVWVLSQSGTLSASHASVVAICNGAVIALTSLVGFAMLLAIRGSRPTPLLATPPSPGRSDPIVRGEDMHARTRLRDQTIADFGDQWTRYTDNQGYYGSAALLRDIVEPLLPLAEIRGMRVADIGSGTGRIVNMLLDAGAEHVVAVEPSSAFDVLCSNVSRPDAVTLMNVTGDSLPPLGDLDLVVSIGVLHHIPDPEPVVAAAFAAMRPGGRMLAWLYGQEGNQAYLAVAKPLRAVTRRLPHPMLAGTVRLMYPVLSTYMALSRHAELPLRDYLNNYLGKLSREQRLLVMYDQLNPAYAKYYTGAQARELFEQAGFVDVRLHHRHGYSWTVMGTKPQS